MQQAESLSLEQIECFLDGCQSVAFEGGNRSDKYALVESVLKRHHYADQKRSVKGLLRRYLAKLTGLSRAQLTRPDRTVLAHALRPSEGLSAAPFSQQVHTRRQRLTGARRSSSSAPLGAGHPPHSPTRVPDLRPQRVSTWPNCPWASCTTCEKEPSTNVTVCISTRPVPRPLRSANAANPEREDVRATCASTPCTRPNRKAKRRLQHQCGRRSDAVAGRRLRQRSNEITSFPCWKGFWNNFHLSFAAFTPTMAANSSTIQTLNCSRSCELNLRSLARAVRTTMPVVETKNGAVVRKWMGYQFLPSEATQAIDTFYRQWLNPYLNFHRPCAFASERRDRRGKLRKVYAEWSTPWEKLLSLPAEQRGLRADRSLKKLQARADTCSDTEFAEHSTLSATNCNASAKTSRSAGARARQRPDRGVVGSSAHRPKTAVGSRLGWLQRGTGAAAPSPLCNPPHPALRAPQRASTSSPNPSYNPSCPQLPSPASFRLIFRLEKRATPKGSSSDVKKRRSLGSFRLTTVTPELWVTEEVTGTFVTIK